jgi:hypothetical protein
MNGAIWYLQRIRKQTYVIVFLTLQYQIDLSCNAFTSMIDDTEPF